MVSNPLVSDTHTRRESDVFLDVQSGVCEFNVTVSGEISEEYRVGHGICTRSFLKNRCT